MSIYYEHQNIYTSQAGGVEINFGHKSWRRLWPEVYTVDKNQHKASGENEMNGRYA